MYLDLEEALDLWEALHDEAVVFIPVLLGNTNVNSSIYLENHPHPAHKNKMLLRVFLSKEEADAYRLTKKVTSLTTAKTALGYLMKTIEKNWGGKIDKKIDCVLSTVDVDNNFYVLETLWSNSSKPV